MVDFNNDSTVSTPPGDVVKIVVLERREQVIEALESFHFVDHGKQDTSHKLAMLYSRIMALWYQIQAMVYRRLGKAKGTDDDPSYAMIELLIVKATKKEEMIEAYQWMNCFIDDMGLTFIDSRARYDRTNIEDSNVKKGM